MEQDEAMAGMIAFRDFDIKGERLLFEKKDLYRINDFTMLELSEQGGEIAPDFIQNPVSLVSETVKEVIDMYEDFMEFPTVVLHQPMDDTMKKYYHLILERLDVLSDQTESYPNGSVKRLVLDKNKIAGHHAFFIQDPRFSYPYVSLEVVESFLYREVIGMKFKEVEVR
jgi:hypothetical protein